MSRHALPREQAVEFLGCVGEHLPWHRPFTWWPFRTGMGLRELLGAGWSDLDLGGNVIEVDGVPRSPFHDLRR